MLYFSNHGSITINRYLLFQKY